MLPGSAAAGGSEEVSLYLEESKDDVSGFLACHTDGETFLPLSLALNSEM